MEPLKKGGLWNMVSEKSESAHSYRQQPECQGQVTLKLVVAVQVCLSYQTLAMMIGMSSLNRLQFRVILGQEED
jgi:hypothetical protein